jgi:hypothetical protein
MALTGRLKLAAVTTAHGEPGLTGFGGVTPVFRQVVSTGGIAAPGNKTVTKSESELNTSNCVPVEFETTVWALLTAIAVNEPLAKFNAATAPTNENPFTVAPGTAANPVGLAVGTTILEVEPGSLTPLPMELSVAVLTAKTVLVLESTVATMFRDGDIAIMPGEFPPVRGEIRGSVSLLPLMMTSPPKVNVAVTPCEASTLCGNPLFVDFVDPPPQETTFKPMHSPTTINTLFLKRQAPNDMKKVDLTVKSWIITDPNRTLRPLATLESGCRKASQSCILRNHGR